MKGKPKPKPLCQVLDRCMCSSVFKLKVAAMEAVFVQKLRELASPHTALRKAMVDSNVVVRFVGPGVPLDKPWMHISYVNMSTWMFSVVKLSIDPNAARQVVAKRIRKGVALQRLLENEWLDSCFF